MDNKSYFEYIKKQSFEEKLRAFGHACEDRVRNYYEGSRNGIGKENADYYHRESIGQGERADFLFQELLREFERKGDK